MKTITTTEMQKALQRAANQKGADGAIHQKKLILDTYMLVDEQGVAVDPETVDVCIEPAGTSTTEAEMGAANMAQDPNVYPKNFQSVIRSEIRSALAENTPAKMPVVTPVANPWDLAPIAGRVKNLKNKEEAYKFGAWAAACCGHIKAKKFCADNGIIIKGHSENINSAGGYLVPEEFENSLITLREQYGVIRSASKTYPMSRETLRLPRRVSTLTAYFTGETRAGTESQQVFDNVSLVAKKVMVLTTVSNELLEDALIAIGDDLAGEVAYAFATLEDQCGFLGDGTSTYGGIVGLRGGLGVAGSDQRVISSGIGAAALTATSINADNTAALVGNALARLPGWAFKTNNIKIYCHKSVYHALFEAGAMKVGGATVSQRIDGIATPKFYGYDVVYSQVLPAASAAAATDTIAFIGDLSQCLYFGDRRMTTLDFNDAALNAFEQDERAVRATERFDIVATNLGTASACGPVVHITH